MIFSKKVLHYQTVFCYWRKWTNPELYKDCRLGIYTKINQRLIYPTEMQAAATPLH